MLKSEKHNGALTLVVEWPFPQGAGELRVGFSPLHPFCRPSFQSSALDLPRHQNPLDGGICLITQETEQWYANQLVADFLIQQVAELFNALDARAAEDWATAAAHEENAGDPLLPYFNGLAEQNSLVIFPEDFSVGVQPAGYAEFEVETRLVISKTQIQGRLLRAFDMNRRLLLNKPIRHDGNKPLVEGRWVKLERPVEGDPAKLWQIAVDKIRALGAVMPRANELADYQPGQGSNILAICFKDEVTYDKETKLAWLFLERPGPAAQPRFLRSERLESGTNSRTPFMPTLRSKRALIVGCGAIGSFVAIELARSGFGSLHLWDHDVLLPSNSVRWPLGAPYWGLSKAVALADFIASNYPETSVDGAVGKFGDATWNTEVTRQGENFYVSAQERLRKADIVIDATASSEAQYALSWFCKDLKKPLISVHATAGAAAGVVFKQAAVSAICRICLNEAWASGELPRPLVDDEGMVVPIGCNEATFTGGSFDLEEISLQAVRVAIGSLVPDFADIAWDVAQLELRTAEGIRSVPTWSTYNLQSKACCAANAA